MRVHPKYWPLMYQRLWFPNSIVRSDWLAYKAPDGTAELFLFLRTSSQKIGFPKKQKQENAAFEHSTGVAPNPVED
jgi:hypothetical protein